MIFQRRIAGAQRVSPSDSILIDDAARTKGIQEIGDLTGLTQHLVCHLRGGRRPFQVGQHALDARAELLGGHLFA